MSIVICDKIINIDNYDKEMKKLSKQLGLPGVDWKRYNVDKKKKSLSYRDLYDKRTKSHIERYFAEDIDRFKFKF